METSTSQSTFDLFGGGVSPLELKAAQETTLAFLMAVKNYGLFPPDHVSTINLLNNLSATMDGFLQKYGPLHLDIEKTHLRYEEEIVFEENDPDNNPAFIFYRDGIIWLEFLPGLQPHEILAFFRIISRYKLIQEEPEGDLVTELWGSDFEHINYQASDSLWEAEPILEFSLLNPDAQAVMEYGVVNVAGFDLLKSVLGSFSSGAGGDKEGGTAAGVTGAHALGLGVGAGPGLGPGDGSGVGSGLGARPGSGAATVAGRGIGTAAEADDGPGGGAGLDPGPGGAGGSLDSAGFAAGPGAGSGLGLATDTGYGPRGGAGLGLGLGPGPGPGEGTGVIGGVVADGVPTAPHGGGESGIAGRADGGRGSAGPHSKVADGEDFWATLRRLSPGGRGLGSAEKEGVVVAEESEPVHGHADDHHRREAAGGVTVYSATGHVPGTITDGKPGVVARSGRRDGGPTPAAREGGGTSSTIADRKATAFSRPGRGGDWSTGEEKEESYISVNVASIEPGHSLWQFSSEEKNELARMVREHEEGDNNSGIVELLLILLRLEDEPLILVAILAFLKEEFRMTLGSRNFDIGHQLLSTVNTISRELPPDREWAQPLLSRFFEDIVEPEILDSLTNLWPELPAQKPEVLENLSNILRALPPKAGVALVPLLPKVETGVGRRILIDMIGVFASRDLTIIDKMLDRPEEDLILKLIHILRDSTSQRLAEELLLKILKHPKDLVRQEACGILIERDTERYDRIFQLIYDSNPHLREMAFRYLGRERNRDAEKLLLSHLASERFQSEDNEHISNCYLALGYCGSDESVPYLKQVLFGQPWNFLVGLGAGVHRQGAALALSKLRTRASIKLLGEAESSSIPHIRKAWAKATGR